MKKKKKKYLANAKSKQAFLSQGQNYLNGCSKDEGPSRCDPSF